MTSPLAESSAPTFDRTIVAAAMERASARVAPTWPLDRFIAVNPFWERTERTPSDVSKELTSFSGSRLIMSRAWFRAEFRAGTFGEVDLRESIARNGGGSAVDALKSLMEAAEPSPLRRATVTDCADSLRDLSHRMPWRDYTTHSISQFCASYFDDGQARSGPDRTGGLFAAWRRHALSDLSPSLLMGSPKTRAEVRRLPSSALDAACAALGELEVPERELENYLTALLLDVNGWASWCSYLRWTARFRGGSDRSLFDLLAVRLAWELMLHRSVDGVPERWRRAKSAWTFCDSAARESQEEDWLLQSAVEIAWQREVCRGLAPGAVVAETPGTAAVRAYFCIDVRSEVFRRALEATSPDVLTSGFAGFFGMPVEYRPLGAAVARPQLPGLLAPRMCVTDVAGRDGASTQRGERLGAEVGWRDFKVGATSCFAFVEALGFLSLGKLLSDAFSRRPETPVAETAGFSVEERTRLKPRLSGLAGGGAISPADRAALAAGMLRAMALTRDFPRLVALVGHGSETRNNPHRAGLDCGACCGQTGEVNARAAAALLNDPETRAGLATLGIVVPPTTRFVAGLHNTTVDEVALFDLDELPASHEADVAAFRRMLSAAGDSARRERAPRLGINEKDDRRIRTAIEFRARDWAEVRPEWGLADNAAFIVAPRERTRRMNLRGRCFLHDYRYTDDVDGSILELIMTAPMVVTHWINFQYYASTVDNARYGSGSKVLHNVVGGHLGVFEGNGGDLRIGLAMQSLHNGAKWVHHPLRLSVFIEAPQEGIDAVLRKHEKVRQLVDNEWLYLFRIDPASGTVTARRRDRWGAAPAV